MYTFYGRFLFVVFSGSLCFGLKDPEHQTVVGDQIVFGFHWLGILTGVLSWMSALFNVWAMCNYPEYSLDRGGMLVSGGGSGNGQNGTRMEEGMFEDGPQQNQQRAPAPAKQSNSDQTDNPFA